MAVQLLYYSSIFVCEKPSAAVGVLSVGLLWQQLNAIAPKHSKTMWAHTQCMYIVCLCVSFLAKMVDDAICRLLTLFTVFVCAHKLCTCASRGDIFGDCTWSEEALLYIDTAMPTNLIPYNNTYSASVSVTSRTCM